MKVLLNYNSKLYLKRNQFVIPIIAFILFQQILYGTSPISFIPSMMICANMLFCIMAWIGFSYTELEDNLTEQIVYLKIRNDKLYWMSKIVFMSIIGILLAIISVGMPILINLLRGGESFDSEILVSEVVMTFIVQSIVALMGALLGMVFQVKVTRNKNLSMMFICILGLMAIVKEPMALDYPITKIFTWILPPIGDLINLFMADNISGIILLITFIYAVIYLLIIGYLYIRNMRRILF